MGAGQAPGVGRGKGLRRWGRNWERWGMPGARPGGARPHTGGARSRTGGVRSRKGAARPHRGMPDPIQGVRGALRAAPPAEQGALEGVFTGKAALEKRERKKPAVIVLKMNDSPLAALARLALGSSGLLSVLCCVKLTGPRLQSVSQAKGAALVYWLFLVNCFS